MLRSLSSSKATLSLGLLASGAAESIPGSSELVTWQGRVVRPSEALRSGDGACGDGYSYSHDGWWSNSGQLKAPYGKVISAAGTTVAECRAACEDVSGCAGFNLWGSQDCWIYDVLGDLTGSDSVACVKAAPADDAVRFSWEGVQARMTVQGATSVSMRLSTTFPAGSPRFRVFVDGALANNLTVAQQSRSYADYTLVDGLDASKTHQVTAWYITDPVTLDWNHLPNRWLSVKSFETDGSFGPAPQQRPRRLQIIGDSITAGNQINKADCLPDHSGTYGAKLCEHFQANCQTLAISGKGIYQNCCDDDVTMTELYQRSIVGDPTSVYDDAQFVPDAVLLNLGTNDQGHDTGADWVEGFTQTYADFLVNLTKVHGDASLPIFCGVGPITSSYGPWVQDAMARAKSRGVSSLHYLDFGSCTIDGCGHPGWIGHEQMFQVAAPMMTDVLGWSVDGAALEVALV